MEAKKTPGMEKLFSVYGGGGVDEANRTMAGAGICKRVIKNLAANRNSVPAANDFAISIAANENYPNLIPTGSIHLHYPGNEAEIDRLAEAGIKGIALNSSWQGFEICDPRLRDVYKKIAEHKMFVLVHAGVGRNESGVTTWPEHVMRTKDMLGDAIIIAAHFGANGRIDKALEYMGTSGILLDLAWVMECCRMLGVPDGKILEIIDRLGADKFLFGSDYPWTNPRAQLRFWKKLLSPEVWRQIAYENAVRELRITI